MNAPRKISLKLIAGMLVSIGSLAAAQAAGGPNYFSAWGGYNALEDSDIGSPGIEVESDFDGGFGVGVAYGRWFDTPRHWRGEVELGYRGNDVDDVSGVGSDGEFNALTGMVNGYYDFLPDARLSPYVGVGVGYADVEADGVGLAGGGELDDDDGVFAYQAMVGANYQLNPGVDLFGEVRYLDTDDLEFNGGESEYESFTGLAGVRYRF